MSEKEKQRKRNIVGNVPVERESCNMDNLAIVLCSYFSEHENRPEDDEKDPETGWGTWVLKKTDEALDIIAEELLTESKQP